MLVYALKYQQVGPIIINQLRVVDTLCTSGYAGAYNLAGQLAPLLILQKSGGAELRCHWAQSLIGGFASGASPAPYY